MRLATGRLPDRRRQGALTGRLDRRPWSISTRSVAGSPPRAHDLGMTAQEADSHQAHSVTDHTCDAFAKSDFLSGLL
jgi:hypothetical protein